MSSLARKAIANRQTCSDGVGRRPCTPWQKMIRSGSFPVFRWPTVSFSHLVGFGCPRSPSLDRHIFSIAAFMTSLRMLDDEQKSTLAKCIDQILHRAGGSAQSQDTVNQVFRDVFYLTRERVVRFAHLWNDTRGVACCFPVELLVSILQYLSLQDRLQARFVCRAWNCIIDSPSVWSSLEIRNPGCSILHRTSWIETLWRISRPMPLNITFTLTDERQFMDFSEAVAALLFKSIHRVAHLRFLCQNVARISATELLERPAPQLRTLVYCKYSFSFTAVPPILCPGADCNLRRLELGCFRLADYPTHPVPTMRYFSGSLLTSYTDGRSLFAYFPNLMSLTLSFRPEFIERLPIGAFPLGLRRLKLFDDSDDIFDWGNIISRLPRSLERLVVSCISDFHPWLEFFKSMTCGRQWWLQMNTTSFQIPGVGSRSYSSFSASGRSFAYTFAYECPPWGTCLLHSLATEWLARDAYLTRMEVTRVAFEVLLKAGTSLPSLYYLLIDHIDPRTVGDWAHSLIHDDDGALRPPRFRAQGLECLTFKFKENSRYMRRAVRWFSRYIPDKLRSMITFDARRLMRLSLIGRDARFYCSHFNWARMQGVTEEIIIQEHPGGDAAQLTTWEEYDDDGETTDEEPSDIGVDDIDDISAEILRQEAFNSMSEEDYCHHLNMLADNDRDGYCPEHPDYDEGFRVLCCDP
ncbi:hypothetical protein BKA62DRAFT_128691 [Auriculariales sp. MPI-PUGE-AT-0066]|nr:hypothetical protein BKA62DRAFT_128691 [Auriculariales sp. MPI-PUGE-AT-0066]